MSEEYIDRYAISPEAYVQYVRNLLSEVRGWCEGRDLTVDSNVVTINQEGIPKYEAPSLHVSKGGVALARLEPVGSKVICAQGRVELIGRMHRRQGLVFRVAADATFPKPNSAGEKTGRYKPPTLARVDKDGWYWTEGAVLRPKLVDESLFLDLLTYVSDYEFF